MKKLKTMIAVLVAAATLCVACFALTGCGENAEGTYTVAMDSKTFFGAQEVKDDIASCPGKYVKINQLYMMMCPSLMNAEGNMDVQQAKNVENYYIVKLELKGGNYTLTKTVKTEEAGKKLTGYEGEGDLAVTLTFTGKYTEDKSDKTKVTLATPDKVTGRVVVAGAGAAYCRFSANYANIDVPVADIDDILYPGKFFYYFNSMYFVDCGDTFEAMTVTIDKEATTFAKA